MARERLTSRARQAADDQNPYPGSINQEGREEEQRGSMTYRTFEPSVANHEMTDYTKVHGVSDQHNEVGFGIPDPASGMLVASADYQAKCIKAAELAETFLGPKVSDRMLLAQARDFLSMKDETLDRTLERFNRTDGLYVASDEEDAVEDVEEEAAEGETVEQEEEAAEEVAEVEEGEGEVEEEAAEEEAVAEEVAIEVAPVAVETPSETKVEETTDNPTRDIPEMPEGQAASPQVNTMSEAQATNLAMLASCTLGAEECSQENIVAQAQKFAGLDNEQVKTLLAGFGKVAVEDDEKVAEVAEEVELDVAGADCAGEEVESEVTVSADNSIDISSLNLTEDFNDGAVAMTAAEEQELASAFGAVAPVQETTENALTASIAALAGGRSKVASKVGVKSIGKVTLQNNQPSEPNELEGLWNAPGEFPGGGF